MRSGFYLYLRFRKNFKTSVWDELNENSIENPFYVIGIILIK